MVEIKAFFDKTTSTLTYIVFDPQTNDAIVLDPVLDYDPASSKTAKTALQPIIAYLKEKELNLRGILETHAHADHLSSAPVLKSNHPKAVTAIGERITEVQKTFSGLFGLKDFPCDGRQFDHLLKDGETFKIGSLSLRVFSTPGHTPACCSYLIGENLFTGDALFMPDSGVGRCDFPGGSAETLYASIKDKIYKLPDETRTFTGHDYQPGGRDIRWQATIKEHKQGNIHLKGDTTKEAFVKFRTERDKTLSAPKLLLPSIQININAGKLPQFLSIPVVEA